MLAVVCLLAALFLATLPLGGGQMQHPALMSDARAITGSGWAPDPYQWRHLRRILRCAGACTTANRGASAALSALSGT